MISKKLGGLSLAVAAVGLFYATAPALAQQKTITVWFGKGFYKSEDDALSGGDQEIRGQDRHQGRTVAIRHSGHDPEDGGGAGFRHRARRRLFRQL